MDIYLNGKAETVPDSIVLMDIIKSKKLLPETVIVEINGKIFKKNEYRTPIQEKDKIEILRFVGGG
jgi:thiamine biosynthesis protein ThiS